MSHPFGDLLGQFLHRKRGLSQFKLADGIDQQPSVISEMCQGKRLTGAHARTRVVEIILWLQQHDVLFSPVEANDLLKAAGLAPLNVETQLEAKLLGMLSQDRKTVFQAQPGLEKLGSVVPHNLPEQFTRFIGRSEQINQLIQLVHAHRMITLTGVGGVGKTRLALEVAKRVMDVFQDGVWFIDLAPLSDPTLLPQVILQALQAPEQPARSSLMSLITFLRTKNLLLVIDNCEHLLDGIAQFVDQILRSSPHIHFLATSREAVKISAEFIWQVPSLTCPPLQYEGKTASVNSTDFIRESAIVFEPGSLEQFEAVKLFVDRLQHREPVFKLQTDNTWAVANICSRLDGIPLALEMTAVWINVLSIEEIAMRLSGAIDARFQMLTNSSRTVSYRQQTLRATLEWSYALLSPTEQRFLLRLPVFVGGWTLDAAEKICSDEPARGISPSNVLLLLAALIEKSLVIADRQNEQTRYRMLETIRQFAVEKLANEKQPGGHFALSINDDQMRERHLEYYVKWIMQAVTYLPSQDEPIWLVRLEQEHDNIRAAIEWGSSRDRCAEQVLQMAIAASRFFQLRGYVSEARSYLSAALSHEQAVREIQGEKTPTALRALGLTRLARLASLQGDFPVMQSLFEESMYIFHALGLENSADYAEALTTFGDSLTIKGDFHAANIMYCEALSIFRQLNDTSGMCEALSLLAWSAMRVGDYPEAEKRLKESLELARKKGFARIVAFAAGGLGELSVRQGQYELAEMLLEESLAIRRSMGDLWGAAGVLGTIGWAALRQGDFQKLRLALRESMVIRVEIFDKGGIAWCLEKLAEGIYAVARFQPEPEGIEHYLQAVRLYGMAAELRALIGSRIDPVDQPEYNQNIAGLQKQLDEDNYTKAWIEGEQCVAQEQDLPKIIELALLQVPTDIFVFPLT